MPTNNRAAIVAIAAAALCAAGIAGLWAVDSERVLGWFAPAPASQAGGPALNGAGPGRNPDWAVAVDLPGCPNLHRLTPGLYRGAQPSAAGMAGLKAMGVRTVVNLRWLHADQDEIGDLDLAAIDIHMQAWEKDLDDQAVEFLKVVTDPAKQPVFFHCQHGADRTGTMAAIYRMAVQGWSAEAALDEMQNGGYNFHAVWENLPEYLRGLDVEKLRERAGIRGRQEGLAQTLSRTR